jgi:hypothetical protein
MKKTINAIAITLLLGGMAHAQWNNDDVMAAFYNGVSGTGSDTEVVIDLGSANSLSTINLDLSSTLATTFGANWQNNPNISWTLLGTAANGGIYTTAGTGAFNNIYNTATDVQLVNNAIAYGPQMIGASGPSTSTGTVGGMPYYVLANASQVYNSEASTDAGAYFGGLQSGVLKSISTQGQSVNLIDANGNQTSGVASAFITGAGAVVPEPSSYAMFAIGALLLVVAYRRRLS